MLVSRMDELKKIFKDYDLEIVLSEGYYYYCVYRMKDYKIVARGKEELFEDVIEDVIEKMKGILK